LWAIGGRAIAGFLQDDRQRRWFNAVMAVLLIASVLPTMF
jgi:threonine/homoserine/homoserine lactone efflux protein